MRSVDLNSNKTNYYILDAKYYKYGIYPERGENVLPQASDIIKQIAYGDYISNELKKEKHDITFSTYNAFLSPFDSLNNKFETSEKMFYAGKSFFTKERNNQSKHQEVHLILIDTKWLIENYARDIELISQIRQKLIGLIDNDQNK
ncbi:LlaJI restriction endonuclease [Mycoplasmopsis glycophila]|uniref:LlaJI restriction endonuclease n=2 Tax=Mycoplasmopsis glycophila TaxID=171285 RepID=A0A449AUV7_9BACT|nr:LlaJI restriction endonuclease [Mycoplasmopsis glycophila]